MLGVVLNMHNVVCICCECIYENMQYILGISNTHLQTYMSKESYQVHDFDVGAWMSLKVTDLGRKKRFSVWSRLSAARYVDTDVPGEYMDVKDDM